MAGDVDAPAEPDLLMTLGVFKKTLEGREAGRTADQAAVQADGKHLRRLAAFGIQHVEGILEVLEKIVALVETLDLSKAHVVGVQGVRNHQVRLPGGGVRFPVRQERKG